jgi:hypothetical protein
MSTNNNQHRLSAVDKPTVPAPVEDSSQLHQQESRDGEPEVEGIEEVPRLTTTTTALPPSPEKGKSKQPAEDVPQDAISIASDSEQQHHHHHHPDPALHTHTPSMSQLDEERQEHLQVQAAIAAGAAHAQASSYREGAVADEAISFGASPSHIGGDERTNSNRLGREGEHAVTSWLEEELQRVEESALGGRDQTIPEASSSSPIVASASPAPAPVPSPFTSPAPPTRANATAGRATSPTGTPASPTITGGPRHFPPPGTLVVVQGIVHTSDALPASSSTSSSSSSNATANGPSSQASSSSPPPLSRPPATRAQSGSTASSASTSHEASTGNTTPDHHLVEGEEQRPVPPAISNGSIDVLGTLLRYASHLLSHPSSPTHSTKC